MSPKPLRHGARHRTTVAALAWLALTGADVPRSSPLDIQADRVELDPKGGTATFEGNIVARQEGLELRCGRLVAKYTQTGELVSLVAHGALRLKSPELEATAERAEFDRAADLLTLTGAPTVVRGGDRISGDVARFWPRDRRLVVEKARGQLRAPSLLGRASSPAASPEAAP